MQVTKEQTAPCTINLSFDIDAETVSHAFDRVYREFSKFTNVPGFRPGKAPRAILEKYVEPTRVQERVKDMIVSKAYREAIEQNEIVPYDDPRANLTDIEDGKSWSFTAEVSLAPIVELGDISTVIAVKPIYEIREEDIDRSVQALIDEHTHIVKVEGRGVQDKDVLIAEIQTQVAGQESFEEPRRSIIRMGENMPAFDEHIMGQMVDEEREFTLTVPPQDDEVENEGSGEQVDYRVKVFSINEPVPPELNDDWVKTVSPNQTVQELRDELRQKLQEQSNRTSNSIAYQNALEKLIEISKLDYPTVMVEKQAQIRYRRIMEEIEESHITYDDYLKQLGKSATAFVDELMNDAESQVKMNLVVSRIMDTEKIEIDKNEIYDEITQIAVQNRTTEEQFKKMVQDRDSIMHAANQVMMKKVEEFVMSKVTLTEEIVSD